jgi:2-oxoglutarate ferredoxin oxidoreductase subunit gamma
MIQIRFCGFGGQGVVLLGEILGHAAMLAGGWAAQSASYGAEARGSTCSSEVLISDSWIAYPKVAEADVPTALSQSGYDQYISQLRPQGLVLFDVSLVIPKETECHYAIPATQLAREELENPIVANMIMIGALAEITQIVPKEKLVEAITARVPSRFLQLNLRAVELGGELGRKA